MVCNFNNYCVIYHNTHSNEGCISSILPLLQLVDHIYTLIFTWTILLVSQAYSRPLAWVETNPSRPYFFFFLNICMINVHNQNGTLEHPTHIINLSYKTLVWHNDSHWTRYYTDMQYCKKKTILLQQLYHQFWLAWNIQSQDPQFVPRIQLITLILH